MLPSCQVTTLTSDWGRASSASALSERAYPRESARRPAALQASSKKQAGPAGRQRDKYRRLAPWPCNGRRQAGSRPGRRSDAVLCEGRRETQCASQTLHRAFYTCSRVVVFVIAGVRADCGAVSGCCSCRPQLTGTAAACAAVISAGPTPDLLLHLIPWKQCPADSAAAAACAPAFSVLGVPGGNGCTPSSKAERAAAQPCSALVSAGLAAHDGAPEGSPSAKSASSRAAGASRSARQRWRGATAAGFSPASGMAAWAARAVAAAAHAADTCANATYEQRIDDPSTFNFCRHDTQSTGEAGRDPGRLRAGGRRRRMWGGGR